MHRRCARREAAAATVAVDPNRDRAPVTTQPSAIVVCDSPLWIEPNMRLVFDASVPTEPDVVVKILSA